MLTFCRRKYLEQIYTELAKNKDEYSGSQHVIYINKKIKCQ